MKIDCVKPFGGNFCVIIPMWRQNGGYQESISRIIHVKDEGMGGYLLALILEQQKISLLYQEYLPDDKKNALFAYHDCRKGHAAGVYRVASSRYVSNHLKKICCDYCIHNEKGNPYNVTSHQFRHNGITERLRAGFTMAQIAELTAHHGMAMIYASYAHLNLFPETLIEPNLYTAEESKGDNPYVLFGGRILNMDAINESRLLSNLRAHRVPGGICSGLSRSVFAKPHVYAIINEHYQAYEEAILDEKKTAQKKSGRVKPKDERIRRLTEENAALLEECALLRARLFLLMQQQE